MKSQMLKFTIIVFTFLTINFKVEGFYVARGSPFNLTRHGKARLGGPGLSLRPLGHLIHKYQGNKKGIQGSVQASCGNAKIQGIERTGRIVGGRSVSVPIPWQASLQTLDELGKWQHICGAALISQHHLLTASHCIGLESHTKYRVVLGKVRLNEENGQEQIFYIRDSDITTHRRFGFVTEFGNDIAIIKIGDRAGRGAAFNEFVQPICIPDFDGWEYKMVSKKPHKCIVSGWGSTKGPFYDDFSNSLQVASVPIHDQDTCQKLYNSRDGEWSGNWLRRSAIDASTQASGPRRSRSISGSSPYGGSGRYMDGMMCAGPLSGNYIDSSRGDSGSGLACKVNGQYYLVGIVSWGDHFNAPSVYTRVSHYLPWLNTEKLLLGPAL